MEDELSAVSHAVMDLRAAMEHEATCVNELTEARREVAGARSKLHSARTDLAAVVPELGLADHSSHGVIADHD